MPELPEVETTLNGIKPYILNQKIKEIIIRFPTLRFPIPEEIQTILKNQKVLAITRRAKYILLTFQKGTLILHLGMSGRIRVLKEKLPPSKHDHVDIIFANCYLRFTDPRRFGALVWAEKNTVHPLLANIGPEPLTQDFNGKYLYTRAQGKKLNVKSFIMDSKIVAGVGNIYAAEALFKAKISPLKPVNQIMLKEFNQLSKAIKFILKQAIKKGGTTLKDFSSAEGSPGYFSLKLNVYGRSGKPCYICQTPLKLIRSGQRSTVFCVKCQK